MLLILFVEVVCHSTKQGSQPTRIHVYLKAVIVSTRIHLKSIYFRHLSLSEEEFKSWCRLGLDSWADTGCPGKHAYVDEFVEVKSVNITGFASALVSIGNLPIEHVLYVFYK